jgi:membrane associated rhomboid family serine protease
MILCLTVFAAQSVLSLLGVGLTAFTLSSSFLTRPWTLVLATYAHAGAAHLLVNLLALLVIGLIVERGSSLIRFHLFFIITGALAGIAEIVIADISTGGTAVLGASGAVFGLIGYALTGNRVSGALRARVQVGRSLTVGFYIIVATLLTFATVGPGIALVAHFTGLLIGLFAGRYALLQP